MGRGRYGVSASPPLSAIMFDMTGTDVTTNLPMCTFTGRKFYPLDPTIKDISILDIAHGLSNVCRYGGQCKEFYSVAQHSVLVSNVVSAKNAKWGLLHDASEAYIGDIIHPLKATNQYEFYRDVEENLMAAIGLRFGLDPIIPDEVHGADLYIRHAEMRDFGSVPSEYWADREMYKQTIYPMPPKEAKNYFLEKFSKLFGYEGCVYI